MPLWLPLLSAIMGFNEHNNILMEESGDREFELWKQGDASG
jgi:hypothetical protein